MAQLTSIGWRLALGIWTVAIWGSRLRNILADDELTGGALVLALVIAVGFVVLGFGLLASLVGDRSWHRGVLAALVVVGVVRWTVRGPLILLSDEWELGFKVVHTALWLVTVGLSVAAWRERDTI